MIMCVEGVPPANVSESLSPNVVSLRRLSLHPQLLSPSSRLVTHALAGNGFPTSLLVATIASLNSSPGPAPLPQNPMQAQRLPGARPLGATQSRPFIGSRRAAA